MHGGIGSQKILMQAETERQTIEQPQGEQRKPNPLQTVLLIEPSRAPRERAGAMLQKLGFTPRLAEDTFEAHALVDTTSVVVATHPNAADIYPRLCAAAIPLISAFASTAVRPDEIAKQIGAVAYILKPYRPEQLAAALYAASVAHLLRERAVRAERALTEIGGSRPEYDPSGMLHIDLFKALLPFEIRRARRHSYSIAVCVVALDPLPDVRHLPEVAAACRPLLRKAVRDVDLTVRYGEGRFLVFLPHTDAAAADVVGRRIVREIRSCRIRAGGLPLTVTASVGIAAPRSGKPPAFSRLIRDAHVAMKAAQLKGGDRAIVR
jgi:diguanylate cyclase (GGDEF)-like protein